MKSVLRREGWPFYGPAFLLTVIAFALKLWPMGAVLALATFFLCWFFRDPERIPEGEGILSPADGTVLQVVPLENGGQRVDIFMSVFNVHVNRSPLAGTIRNIIYTPGKKVPAGTEEAHRSNENNFFEIVSPGLTVGVRQIAGILARRIVFWKSEGGEAERGERVGMIKFGSRVEVTLPPGMPARARKGDKVYAGSSILA